MKIACQMQTPGLLGTQQYDYYIIQVLFKVKFDIWVKNTHNTFYTPKAPSTIAWTSDQEDNRTDLEKYLYPICRNNAH